MDKGWAGVVKGSGWTGDKRTHGLRGYFRNTEVVHSEATGWNVHFHAILLLDVELDEFRLCELKASVVNRFIHGVARAGGHAAEHLQDLRPMTPGSEECLAAYCLKGAKLQTSANGSRTPMAILDHLESTGEGFPLWEEFASAVSVTKRMQFVTSTRIEELVPR